MDHSEPPFWVAFSTYLSYAILIGFGHLRDFFRTLICKLTERNNPKPREPYAPLVSDFDDFYTRRLYYRIRDGFNRPIDSKPGARIVCMGRELKDSGKIVRMTGEVQTCINLSSYNYLGFAENPEHVDSAVHASIDQYSVSLCSATQDIGTCAPLREAEKITARFVGKEDAIIVGMGFATNQTVIPTFCDRGTLIVSDHLNHSSLVQGCRGGAAKTKVFKHNDYNQLERVVRRACIEGQPGRRRAWNKIIILIEGIYSMEGEIADLKRVVEIKKKYKCYLYVDEAHSIGALGKTGRGICEYCGVDPADVDILMGTYTKSFGGIGGYIAADKNLIRYLRATSPGLVYANALSPVICQQVVSALKVIAGEDGTDLGKQKIQALADNARYFRKRLEEMKFIVYGADTSPVIPVMLYHPAKISAVTRECLKRGLAVVTVGYPATPLIESRVRFCLSAAHTKELLDEALDIIDEVGDLCQIKYQKYL
eukprot:NODE_846_length_1600_cov_74.924644_g836_i0.p1 GENE.NODE_846_length_1600_cov_74.924644_g836_i0~~NODE_846_length_1600_cov_74.924644_g836_i0.p1  ORF type:complete len:482 (-),score=82.38 NODE_846_length_1600_cov_74.924644_g836_i0:58-1503(-)